MSRPATSPPLSCFDPQSHPFELASDASLYIPSGGDCTFFGLISGEASRIYVKNCPTTTIRGSASSYISPQANGLAEFHIDQLVADLEILQFEGRRLFEKPGEPSSCRVGHAAATPRPCYNPRTGRRPARDGACFPNRRWRRPCSL